ncbi:MAG: hypothetical protein RMJ53_08335 [Chitinophagales bacterium]|nr:hypothetical protein [Chitinophagales bacterium]MDW8274217.1 hypothetical protein [Chitinophagales bacterium]
MHHIEPFYAWLPYYSVENDIYSPFYRSVKHRPLRINKIYNFIIHPQWDYFGSSTLYCKVLFADYSLHFAIIELLGEWNDAINNDIMELKRGLIDRMIAKGIFKFILIGENVLNFHASDDLYYEEWNEDIRENHGWVVLLNFREHVLNEMRTVSIHHYIHFLVDDYTEWRKSHPVVLQKLIEKNLALYLK